MRNESLEELNWTRLASWSSQINPLDPFTTLATPCFLWLWEPAGFWKFSSRTVSSCSFPSQRAHDHWLALNFIILCPPLLLFLSPPLPKTQKSPLTQPPPALTSFLSFPLNDSFCLLSREANRRQQNLSFPGTCFTRWQNHSFLSLLNIHGSQIFRYKGTFCFKMCWSKTYWFALISSSLHFYCIGNKEVFIHFFWNMDLNLSLVFFFNLAAIWQKGWCW